MSAVDDVAVGRCAAARGEPEDRFERDVPMKAAVVAKYEFIENRDIVNRNASSLISGRPE